MDVTLVLTHRCNLACHYCYAGEHIQRDMTTTVRERAVDLLFSDGADTAQLGFFGGEPFIAYDEMRLAVAEASARAQDRDVRLLLQCTTNATLIDCDKADFIAATGMKVTVSIDGVREAHDINRPRAGGKRSSFDDVHRGLRLLLDRGLRPDTLMVVTPETAPLLARSVAWLWDEGVARVRCNIELTQPWDDSDRYALRGELETIGWEMMARRARGQRVSFEPFESAMRAEVARWQQPAEAPGCGTRSPGSRHQVVVATEGNLYPCAPMVGEDRPDGPEAATRIGHLADGDTSILARVTNAGAGCGSDGKVCECAAFLETGDRNTGGTMGLWFGRACADVGASIAVGERADSQRDPTEQPTLGRRPMLLSMAVAATRLALGGSAFLRAGLGGIGGARLADPQVPGQISTHPPMPAGGISAPPEPPPQPPGGLRAPPPPPPEPPEQIEGNMAPPPPAENMIDGDMAAPPPEEIKTLGELG